MARRRISPIGLSLLDAMTCGFGAVILFFMIINASMQGRADTITSDRRSEVDQLEDQVIAGHQNLVTLKNSLRELDQQHAMARGLSSRLLERVRKIKTELATYDQTTLAQREHVNRLQADLKSLEEDARRLSASAPSEETPGDRLRSFVGDGNRQYLTGLRVGGRRVFILVDTSASMLGEKLVNIIRRRNMANTVKIRAGKWQRAVRTVDWLMAQIPRESKFQIYTFNASAAPVIPGTGGQWLDGGDRKVLDEAVARLRQVVPGGGTSLINGLAAVQAMPETPDNLILLTDSLPTQGGNATAKPDRLRQATPEVLQTGDRIVSPAPPDQRDPLPDGRGSDGRQLLLETGDQDRRLVPEPGGGLAMSRRRRHEGDAFNLSFLDSITCGFGAIILLLVLSKIGEPQALELAVQDLDGQVAELQQELHDMQGETTILDRKLTTRREQISEERKRIARLRGDLSRIQGEFAASQELSQVQDIIEGRLLAAQQTLTDEMRRLQERSQKRPPPDNIVGGIPIDSEYIIFIIDTSGSMSRFAWSLARKKMAQTLDIYPQVRGIQVMNDMGQAMFSHYKGKWIPDTPARRRAILERMRSWKAFSNSSPVEGITRAIEQFARQDKKISIYVFGDEFTGSSIDKVMKTVARINPRDAEGHRRVRIHAIGFPVVFSVPGASELTGVRFATLMRALCHDNGGTFVGLNTVQP
ncbi:MAG: VWA domain-containing protein [Acidobacteriota bacterium]